MFTDHLHPKQKAMRPQRWMHLDSCNIYLTATQQRTDVRCQRNYMASTTYTHAAFVTLFSPTLWNYENIMQEYTATPMTIQYQLYLRDTIAIAMMIHRQMRTMMRMRRMSSSWRKTEIVRRRMNIYQTEKAQDAQSKE
eukprot:12221809-Ditylum_brightwellii.AAC.1